MVSFVSTFIAAAVMVQGIDLTRQVQLLDQLRRERVERVPAEAEDAPIQPAGERPEQLGDLLLQPRQVGA